MAKLVCEVCGGKLVRKTGGVTECAGCGMLYDANQVRELAEENSEKEKILSANRKKKARKILKIAIPTLCVAIAAVVFSISVLIPEMKYSHALELMDSGSYEEAIAVFEIMDGYKNSSANIADCKSAIQERDYTHGVSLMEAGEYHQAIPLFKSLGDYEKSIQLLVLAEKEAQYADTVALMEAGDVVKAYEAFLEMNGFKDSAEKASALYEQYKTEKLKVATVGQYVFFGTYEQDNNTSNGKEDIEWLVLLRNVQENRIMVVSKFGLDCYQYQKLAQPRGSWEKHTYRKWLNEKFLNEAFSEEEQARIPTVTVSGENAPLFKTPNVTDKIFLLNSREVYSHLPEESDRLCMPTAYATTKGVKDLHGNTWWGLRDQNGNLDGFSFVWDNGIINNYVCNFPFYFENTTVKDFNKSVVNGAIRPAMWIDLNV